ncbi:hypothetical protein BDN72DRAFT_899777 [Pluteus cervinus]|uniref:Uncharacterized protein n=1 Tax=Pluteus cervinus TaxID=181527 RepID=A0ACD3ALT3_9AGAR|nr:hypothetical protein BDN72DRAFT_899777 [Pluteus cervinus]
MLLSGSNIGSATSTIASPITPLSGAITGMMGPPSRMFYHSVFTSITSLPLHRYHTHSLQVQAHRAHYGSTGPTGSTLINSTGSLTNPNNSTGSANSNSNSTTATSGIEFVCIQSTWTWSSLLAAEAGSLRQFMSGVGDTLKEGLTTPSREVPPRTIDTSGDEVLTAKAGV